MKIRVVGRESVTELAGISSVANGNTARGDERKSRKKRRVDIILNDQARDRVKSFRQQVHLPPCYKKTKKKNKKWLFFVFLFRFLEILYSSPQDIGILHTTKMLVEVICSLRLPRRFGPSLYKLLHFFYFVRVYVYIKCTGCKAVQHHCPMPTLKTVITRSNTRSWALRRDSLSRNDRICAEKEGYGLRNVSQEVRSWRRRPRNG